MRNANWVIRAIIMSFLVLAGASPLRDAWSGEHFLPLVTSASDTAFQSFIRVVNHSDEAGAVRISAIDDRGREGASISLQLAGSVAHHFNSRDLEFGNPSKGLSGGIGSGSVNWSLMLETDLDIEVFAYLRTPSGNLIPVHDLAAVSGTTHYLPTFNPGSNLQQQSKLRLINRQLTNADVEIHGLDDSGELFGPARLQLSAMSTVTLTADELEAGSRRDVNGSLGNGGGKWRLFVRSDEPIHAMTLLEDRQGYLVNLSASKVGADILAGTVDRLFGIRNVPLPSGGTLRTEVTRYTPTSANFTVDMFVSDETGSLVSLGVGDVSIDPFSDLEFEASGIAEVGQSPLGPYSAVFLLDQSGSIVDNDRNDARLDAVKAFLNGLGNGDEAGLLAFALDGQLPESPVTRYVDDNGRRFTSDRRAFDSVLASLANQEDGGTPLYDAICEAVDYVNSYAANSNKAILVFTDGEDTESTLTLEQAIECANGSGIPLHTVALSSSADLNVLTRLATGTEGSISSPSDAREIISYYGVLGNFLSGSSQFHRTSWRLDYVGAGNGFSRGTWVRSWINVDLPGGKQVYVPFRIDFTGDPSAPSGGLSITTTSRRTKEALSVHDGQVRKSTRADLPRGDAGGLQ